MKKLSAIVIAVLLALSVVSLAACQNNDNNKDDSSSSSTPSTSDSQSVGDTSDTEDGSDTSDTAGDDQTSDNQGTTVTNTAYELYSAAYGKTSALTSAAIGLNMNVKMSMEGISMEIPMVYDVKISGLNSESAVYRVLATTSMFGEEVTTDVYAADGYSYYTDAEGNYKVVTGSDYDSCEILPVLDFFKVAFSEELLKDVAVTESEDGSMSFELSLTGEQFVENYSAIVADMSEGESIELDASAYSDVKVSITVDAQGYVGSHSIGFTTVISDAEYGDTTYECVYAISYTDAGTEVTVEAPEGYESYEEFSDDYSDWEDEEA